MISIIFSHLTEDELYYRCEKKNVNLKVVKAGEESTIFEQFHSHPTAGHAGYNATLKKVGDVYYWPGKSEYLRRKVSQISDHIHKNQLGS